MNLQALTAAAPAILAHPGIVMPERKLIRARTRDQAFTMDRMTIDSAGAFLIGELERLDPTLNTPLVAYTWSRDIDVREDVTLADEVSSFTSTTFASPGGTTTSGKAWIGKTTNAITGVAVDINKTPQPLTPWGMELAYTVFELASSQRVGRPIDAQKLAAITLKHQMDIDESVYVGDAELGYTGLFNSAAVTPVNVVNGAASSPLWSAKSPTEILTDVNTTLNRAWAATGCAVVPDRLLLPPLAFSQLNATLISTAGNRSVLNFLAENSLSNAQNGRPLQILPAKWLVNRGAGGTQRMVAYTKDKKYVRYPMTPLQRSPVQERALSWLSYCYCRLGVMEFVYPETIAYADGI